MAIDGDGDDLDFGFDDGLDLSFGDDAGEPADLNETDMQAGTEAPVVVTDLSGAPAPAAPVTAPATPGPAAPVQPQTGQQPPAQQPQAPVPPAQQVSQPPASEQPSAPAQPPVDIEAYVTQNADAILDNLAGSHFKIDDETARALNFSPEVKAFVEKRDARNYLLTMVQVNKALQQTLPAVVANLVQLTTSAKETQDGFYKEFPELQKPDYIPHLKQLGQTLRGLHPQMPRKEFQTLLGSTALQILNVQRQQQPAPPAQQNGRNVRRGVPRPFTPAGASRPQRNHSAPGGQQLSGLEFLNHALQQDFD